MLGPESKSVVKAREILVSVEMLLHILAAILLLIGCLMIFYYATLNLLTPNRSAVFNLINDVLLALIILELLWTVIRFLKKQKFIIAPFLAIGIIAAVRRILLIEAQTSFMDHVPHDKLIELALSTLIIITLMVAYYLSVKAQKIDVE
ncbi:MAG: phosphate-starvation-inducible PsiE family protein [Thermodesulfovibrionales bacterium]|nr:phosphate-starvation-inducible PsiE family protein [Thermodesulfovibrionales bacterium]